MLFQSFGKLRYDPPEYENESQDFKVYLNNITKIYANTILLN